MPNTQPVKRTKRNKRLTGLNIQHKDMVTGQDGDGAVHTGNIQHRNTGAWNFNWFLIPDGSSIAGAIKHKPFIANRGKKFCLLDMRWVGVPKFTQRIKKMHCTLTIQKRQFSILIDFHIL